MSKTDVRDETLIMEEMEFSNPLLEEEGLSKVEIKSATLRDHAKFLRDGTFLFCIIKRLIGIFMMLFDMGSDLKLAYDLALPHPDYIKNAKWSNDTNSRAISQNESFHNWNISKNTSFSIQNNSSVFNLEKSGHISKIQHPYWFSLTLIFFYLPHFSRVWTTNLKELFTKFLFHGFHPINLLEKEEDASLMRKLPRWAFALSFIDANKCKFKECTTHGKIILILFWPFLFVIKVVFFFIMPLLVVLRQLRSIPIVIYLEEIKINLGLSKNTAFLETSFVTDKDKTSFFKRDKSAAAVNGSGANEQFGYLEKIFKEPRKFLREPKHTDDDWDKIYVSEQSKLLDSLMTLSQERNQETFFESAPQAVLQIYMSMTSEQMSYWRLFSIATSILALGLASCDYTDHKLKRHWTREEPTMYGTAVILLWKLPTLAARCISLAVFCAFTRTSTPMMALLAIPIAHFKISFYIEYHSLDNSFKEKMWKSPFKLWRTFVKLCEQAWISFFSLLEYRTKRYDKEVQKWEDHDDPRVENLPKHHLRNLILYNLLLCLENAVLLVPWYITTSTSTDKSVVGSQTNSEVRLLILVLVLFASPVSILFMMFFLLTCHTSDNLLKKAKKYLFQKSPNFLELQFIELHQAILQSSVKKFKSLLEKHDEDGCKQLLLKMRTLSQTDSLVDVWKKNSWKLVDFTNQCEIGNAMGSRLGHKENWCLHIILDKLNNGEVFRSCFTECFKTAWNLSQALCKVEDLATRMFSACYFYTLMFQGQAMQEDVKTFTHSVCLAADPFSYLKAEWPYTTFNWLSLRLYPTLVHQLKVVLNPELKEFPTYLNFLKGPAFMPLETMTDLVQRFVAKLSSKPDGNRASIKRAELFAILERKNPQVTGNDFFKLKHKKTGKTFEEEFPGLITSIMEAQIPFKPYSTFDFVRFISIATSKHKCKLTWFFNLSPNWWPTIFSLMLENSSWFDFDELKRPDFLYWENKFTNVELQDIALTKVISEKNNATSQIDPAASKLQLEAIMGRIKIDINMMRKICEESYKDYNKEIEKEEKLHRSVAKKTEYGNKLSNQNLELQKQIADAQGNIQHLTEHEQQVLNENLEKQQKLVAQISEVVKQTEDFQKNIAEMFKKDPAYQTVKEFYEHEQFLSDTLKKSLGRFNLTSPSGQKEKKRRDSMISLASSSSHVKEGHGTLEVHYEELDTSDQAVEPRTSTPKKSEKTYQDQNSNETVLALSALNGSDISIE